MDQHRVHVVTPRAPQTSDVSTRRRSPAPHVSQSGVRVGSVPRTVPPRTVPAPSHPRGVTPAPERARSSAGLRIGTPLNVPSPVLEQFARLRQPGAVDYTLLLTVVALLLFGLVMVYSASQFAVTGDPGYWVRHQAIWMLLGSVALFVTSRVDYHFWRRVALPGMACTLVLLLVVVKVGHTAYGAQRWLHLGLFSFQPSELTKLVLAIYVADWLVRAGDGVRTLRSGLIPFTIIMTLVLGLILLQNDMGTSLVVGGLALAMFFAAGAPLRQLLPTLGLVGLVFWGIATHTSFRRARLDAFLHPLPPGCMDATSYQVCQGLISLGSGGWLGRGLGTSVQKAGYLPNPFTDSIFAVIGEELGLLGCALLLGLVAVLAFRGLRIGRRAADAYGALLACGITCWLVVQAAINIGSVVNLIPFTGVPLPFVSFGGSSLVTSLAAIGILLNISRNTIRPTTEDAVIP